MARSRWPGSTCGIWPRGSARRCSPATRRTSAAGAGTSAPRSAAAEAVRRVLGCPDLELAGLHSHIGSQVTEAARFEAAARLMAGLAAAIRDEHGVQVAELDLGGGFGIAYTAGDRPADPAAIAA